MQAAVSIVDTFSRNNTDSWGVTDTGQTWLNEISAADVDGTYGTISVAVNASYRTHYIDLQAAGIGKQGESSILSRFRWSSSVAYPNTDFGLVLNRTASNNFYVCTVQDNYDEVVLGVYINGTRWELNRGGILLQKDTDYWMRYEVSTNSGYTRVKIWKSGTAEPGTWTLTSGLWSGSNPPGAGDCGVFYKGTSDSVTAKFSAFYYYTGDDSEPGLPTSDLFERTSTNGFGVASNGAVWQGTVAMDPDVYNRTALGSVSDPGDGYAEVSINETVSRYGLIGARRAGNAEVYTEFSMNSSAGTTFFYLGLRGRLNPIDGTPSPQGYGVYIQSGATTISLRKCSGGTWGSALATSGAFTALAANTTYSVRFQATGTGTSTVLRARIWVTGAAEPGTWNVTYNDTTSPITDSGSSWFELAQSVSTSRVLRLYRWDYQLPTATVTNTETTTVSVTSSSITDVSLSLRANFTGDTTGMNNTISVRYRPLTSSTWSTSGITVSARQSTYWPFAIAGLAPGTSYQVEVTYDDADGVSGTNPIRATFTTTQNRPTPGVVSVTNVSETSATIRAPYAGDTNNTSTATIETRMSSATQYLFSDPMDSLDNVELSLHYPEVGTAWVKRSGVDVLLTQSYAYPDVSGGSTTVYTMSPAPTQTNYTITANVRFNDTTSIIGLVARYVTISGDCYIARYKNGAWEIVRLQTGVETVLASTETSLDIDHVYNLQFVLNEDYKAFLIDGIEVIRTTDNTLAAAGVAGFTMTASPTSVAPYNVPTIGLITLEQRVPGGAWSAPVAMTADRVNKWFTSTVESLASDGVYEFRVIYADATDGGVFGGNPTQIVSAMTAGQAVNLTTISFTPQYTTAVVYVTYEFDTNANSTISLQYRSTMESIWTTVPPTSITVNRGSKLFTGVLVGLRPGISYDVIATVSDPNGVKDKGTAALHGKFTALSTRTSEVTLDKQYIWKVYNDKDTYVGTWRDATVPEFRWNATTGLGDCNVVLNRPFASVNNPTHDLNMMYRVDAYATAPNSDGLTANLLEDPEGNKGMWTLGSNAAAQNTSGPDGGRAIRIHAVTDTPVETFSENVFVPTDSPLVYSAIAKAQRGKVKVVIRAYNSLEEPIQTSQTFATTVGTDWQKIRFAYTPPRTAAFVRIVISNDGAGTMWVAKSHLSATEHLIYRGYIQSYTAEVDSSGEHVEVELYSVATILANDYVEWLQFMTPVPAEDAAEGKPNNPSADPSEMLKALIDLAAQQNPRFSLSYTDTSIKATGTVNDYTFEDMTFQNAFEAIIDISPPGWTINIEPSGVVHFFGPTHATTHNLRLGVEVLSMTKNPSVRDVINYVVVYGKHVEGQANPDDNVKIKYIAFDQDSIDKHGRRVHIERNSGIETDRAAEIVAEGKLAEFSTTKESMEVVILDQNSLSLSPMQTIRGYPIERLRPGDYVIVTDPIALPEESFWDSFIWDQDAWDGDIYRETLVSPLPIKSITYEGDSVKLDLSERPPSVTKAFGRMWRYLQKQEREDRLGIIKD